LAEGEAERDGDRNVNDGFEPKCCKERVVEVEGRHTFDVAVKAL
jgi:hypothetical protein